MAVHRHELSWPLLEQEGVAGRSVAHLKTLFAAPVAAAPDRFGNRQDQRTKVTPEGVQLAQDAQAWCYPVFRWVMEEYMTTHHRSDGDAVRAAREEDELRVVLGMMLLDELDRLAEGGQLPERVRYQEITKQINHAGYPDKVESREAAALIALSLLDGTFQPVRGGDEIVVDADGEVRQGQHRAAALMALGLWGQSSVAQQVGYR